MKKVISLSTLALALTVAVGAFAQTKKAEKVKVTKQSVSFKLGDEVMKGFFSGEQLITLKISGGDACIEEGKTSTEKSDMKGTCTNVFGVPYACSCEVDMTYICTDGAQKLQSSVVTNICTATGKPIGGGVKDPLQTQTVDGR